MSAKNKAYVQLHLAILLFALTAILGDFIQLPALYLVWWRMLFALFGLSLFVKGGRNLRLLTRKQLFTFLGIGVIVALHWITFFGAIKLANASVALVCLATTSFMTAFIEPWLLKTRINKLELLFGLLIIPGMMLIVTDLDLSMYQGLLVGLCSALLAATFTCLNKKFIHLTDSFSITFLEIGGGWMFISLLLPFFTLDPFLPTGRDWIYLLFLALGCTTLAYSLSVQALRQLSAFVSNLSINLEPVYGIILAIFILNEQQQLGTKFYLGFGIIICAIFSFPVLKYYLKKRHKSELA